MFCGNQLETNGPRSVRDLSNLRLAWNKIVTQYYATMGDRMLGRKGATSLI